MTNDSKENLLKILVNDPEETPHNTLPEFTSYSKDSQYSENVSIGRDVFQYQGKTIGLSGGMTGEASYYAFISMFGKDGEILFQGYPKIGEYTCMVHAIDMDSEGNVYAFVSVGRSYGFTIGIAYLDLFQVDTDGNYSIRVKKFYDISAELVSILGTTHQYETDILTDFDIKKSPLGGQFFITLGLNKTKMNYNLLELFVDINVGTENQFNYKLSTTATVSNYTFIKNVETNWTDEGVNYSTIIMTKQANTTIAQTTTANFNLAVGEMSLDNATISWNSFRQVNNYIDTTYKYVVEGYDDYVSDKNAVQKDNYIYILYNEKDATTGAVTSTIEALKRTPNTTTITGSYYLFRETGLPTAEQGNTSVKGVHWLNIAKINNVVFAWTSVSFMDTNTPKVKNTILLIEENKTSSNAWFINTYAVGAVVLFDVNFNVYEIIGKPLGVMRSIVATIEYNSNNYNSTPYFSDESVTSHKTNLYTDRQSGNEVVKELVFGRNLYNKTLVGNTINSVTQIPYNYLNDIKITSEELISKTNTIIDSSEQEFTKNKYEELYINNIDSYKIYDNNNGSSYQQKPSLELTKNIFNGFEDNFKITNYRINYSDNTHTDEPIRTIQRNGNIATIYLYIYADKQIDNIQLYDSNYTTPFITIKPSLELNKLYVITQKVKVE